MEKITRESWKLIAEEIINIVEDNRDYGNDEITAKELEQLFADEDIIEVVED